MTTTAGIGKKLGPLTLTLLAAAMVCCLMGYLWPQMFGGRRAYSLQDQRNHEMAWVELQIAMQIEAVDADQLERKEGQVEEIVMKKAVPGGRR